MVKFRYLLIFSLFSGLTARGQEAEEAPEVTDTLETEVKTNFIRPSLSIDYGKIVTNLIGFEDKLEGSLSLLFSEHYELIGEAGYALLAPEESYTNGDYSAEGMYLRVGASYLIPYPLPITKIGIGVRYGISQFKDQGMIRIVSPTVGGAYERSFERNNLESRWWEVVITSEKKIAFNKNQPGNKINHLFSLGFFLRMRVLVTYDQFEPVDVYSIPGYGKSIDRISPAFNLFVKFTPF